MAVMPLIMWLVKMIVYIIIVALIVFGLQWLYNKYINNSSSTAKFGMYNNFGKFVGNGYTRLGGFKSSCNR